MKGYEIEKVLIVEGTSDKQKVQKLIKEEVEIICTNGTIGISRLDEMIESISDKEVYILVDADDSGERIRKQFKRELPEAKHLYIDRKYREVASAPDYHLASVLLKARIDVYSEFL